MLEITIKGKELWDETNNQFIYTQDQILKLEHSLVSLSKWESKWHKPFLTKTGKSVAETIDYVRFMTLNKNVDPDVYNSLSNEDLDKIYEYIDDPMTATTFSNKEKGTSREQVTAELIYYWMITLNVPFECQKWHLNRLLTLIRVCNIKNTPPKKMGRNDLMRRNAALNAARRKKLNSKG